MTALAAMKRFITPQEYLEGELRSEVRHEYVDGQVYAMVGASRAHGRMGASWLRWGMP